MQLDRYRIDGEIARGGMGVVYRAFDPQLGRPVAIKSLLAARDNAKARARFDREVRSLIRLNHPHIVTVHTAGEARGTPYIVMELIDGESLEDRIDREGPLEGRAAAQMLAKLADAVAHAHASGVLHRDLKPANVLLDRDGTPLLTDFGLARDTLEGRGSLSKTGRLLGTPGYWPPEQARGEVDAIGPPADVYGLGAVLYAALTGQPPILAGNLVELVAATERRPPEPPSKLNPEVDPALDRLCLKCLAKRPAARYPTAAALAEDLQRYLDGEPVWASEIDRAYAQRAAAFVRRNVAALALAVVGLTAVAGLLVAGLASVEPPGERRTAQDGERRTATPRRGPAWPEWAVEPLDAARAALASGDLAAAATGYAALVEGLGTQSRRSRELRAECLVPLILGAQQAARLSAIDIYTGLMTIDPDRVGAWHFLRNMALREVAFHGRANEDLEAALAADPEHALAYVRRAITESPRSHRVHLYSMVLKHDTSTDALWRYGRAVKNRDGLPAALDELERLAVKHPFSAALAETRLHIGLQDWTKAEAACLTALRLEPKSVEAYEHVVTALKMQRRFRSAASHCDTLARLDPERAVAWYVEAAALHAENGRDDRVNASMTQAEKAAGPDREEELAAKRRTLLLRAGRRFAQQLHGQPKDALKKLDELVKAGGEPRELARTHFQRAKLLERLERDREAVTAYRESLKLNPGRLATRMELAETLQRRLGDHPAALAEVEIILATSGAPRLRALYVKSRALQSLRRLPESLTACEAALDDPRAAEYVNKLIVGKLHLTRAELRHSTGDRIGARADADEAERRGVEGTRLEDLRAKLR